MYRREYPKIPCLISCAHTVIVLAERIGAQPLSQCCRARGQTPAVWHAGVGPLAAWLGDGARGSASFDPQHAGGALLWRHMHMVYSKIKNSLDTHLPNFKSCSVISHWRLETLLKYFLACWVKERKKEDDLNAKASYPSYLDMIHLNKLIKKHLHVKIAHCFTSLHLGCYLKVTTQHGY